MKKLMMMIGAAAVAVGADAAWSTDVYTHTSDGVTWRFKINQDTQTAMLGSVEGTAYVSGALASTSKFTGKKTLLESFEVDGVTYEVTDLGRACFEGYNGITSLVFPNVRLFRMYVFSGCKAMRSLWFKGPAKAASGTQTYTKLASVTSTAIETCFHGAQANGSADVTAIKHVLVGPYVECGVNPASPPKIYDATGCTLFLPRSSGHTTWTSYNAGGVNPIKQYYGPDEDLDLAIDEEAGTITATLSTASALTNVLNAVVVFKEDFGLHTKINVTTPIEVGEGLITAENVSYVTLKPFDSLVFAVKTQEQLDRLLAAIPSSIPFAINPADAREELTVTQGREVYVRLSADGRNGKYTPKVNGINVSFR